MRRARLAPAMISMPGHRGPRRRQRGACQPGCHPGKREPSRFESTPSAPLFRERLLKRSPALAGGGVSLFSLALRLLARIVTLVSSLRLQSGRDQAILTGTLIRRLPAPGRIIDGAARWSDQL